MIFKRFAIETHADNTRIDNNNISEYKITNNNEQGIIVGGILVNGASNFSITNNRIWKVELDGYVPNSGVSGIGLYNSRNGLVENNFISSILKMI